MKDSLSVCMISDDFLPSATGVGTHIKLVAPELARRGHKVCVITSRRKGEPEIEQWEGVTIYRVFTIKAFGFYQALPSVSSVRDILDRESPDLVHHHYIGFMLLRVLKIAESMGLPNIYTYHMTEDHLTQPRPLRIFRKLVSRGIVSFCNRMDAIITVSQNMAYQLPGKGIRTNARYITNPVVFADCAEIVPADRTPGFTVLYAGRLGVEKNIGYLIRAFAELQKTVPDAMLWVAGHGPEGPALQRLCGQLNVTAKVKFLGFLDHPTLARHYAACDVFVLPSLIETQGLVAMEAMHFSRPVIVTSAIVSARELVEHGVNGYVVDPESVDDLTYRLKDLVADPVMRASLGEASRHHADAYRPELVVDALEKAYRDVLVSTRRS